MSGGGGGADMENTEAQKAMAEIASKKWVDYNNTFKPVENKFIDDVYDMGGQAAMDEASGIAGVTNAKVTTGAISDTADALIASGVNPNSTQFTENMDSTETKAGGVNADTTSRTQNTQQDRFVQGLDAVNSIGQGKEAKAITGKGDLAQASQSNAMSKSSSDFADTQTTNEAVGAGIGAAPAKWGG